MKKLIITLTATFMLFSSAVNAYAGPVTDNEEPDKAVETVEDEFDKRIDEDYELPYVDFSITDGVNSFKKTESTFDDSRTISGVAETGTIVEFEVQNLNSRGKVKETTTYEVEIGASGIFSQTIDLDIGENVITITASKENCTPIEKEVTIKRKEKSIKNELESSIIIPGNENIKTLPSLPTLK